MALFFATIVLSRGRMTFALALLTILCFTGGLDVAGMLAFGVQPQGEISTSWGTLQVPVNLDWWGIPYAPQSFTTNLYYAPQHFFGALIGTALIYASLQSRQPAAIALIETSIVIAASIFWSPYVAVGLAALALILTLSLGTPGTILQRFRRERMSAVLAPLPLVAFAFAVALVMVSSLFLLASKPLSYPQIIVQKDDIVGWLITYAANYGPYLLALVLILWPLRNFTIEHTDAGFCIPKYPGSSQGVSLRVPWLWGSVTAFTMIGECGSRCRCQSRSLLR